MMGLKERGLKRLQYLDKLRADVTEVDRLRRELEDAKKSAIARRQIDAIKGERDAAVAALEGLKAIISPGNWAALATEIPYLHSLDAGEGG